MSTPCPCRLSAHLFASSATVLNYHQCCAPLHTQAQFAATAEQLMRSRYSAFVLQNIDYIVATTLPSQQPLLDILAISSWAKQTDWAGLEIINHTPKIGKRHAQVEFKAFFKVDQDLQYHHELSTFVKAKVQTDNNTAKDKTIEKWFFVDPTVDMAAHGKTISQKQPCICGSGEKFKRCCGQFL